MARSPFLGDIEVSRVRIFRNGGPTLPVPTPWNHDKPLSLLESIFHRADTIEGSARHNRYLRGFGLTGLVTRDPALIRAILLATGDKPGQFDRDPWPASGIARFTGPDTMLYSNGVQWREQKRLAMPSFSRSTLFQPEKFGEFEMTFRETAHERLETLDHLLEAAGEDHLDVDMEFEISVVMLEMLVNNFFGASVDYEDLRHRYVPAINELITHMVQDTVTPRLVARARRRGRKGRRLEALRQDFEDLTDIALSGRGEHVGAWAQFVSDAPDDALRSNIRVFLAGALEATTSLASWAVMHLSQRQDLQDRIHDEIKELDHYDPENLEQAALLNNVIDETLRLTPSLYFLPRRATVDSWIETHEGKRIMIPKGTRVILDVWHANRNEDFWGADITGAPAERFEPDRWTQMEEAGLSPREMLHFGFGHGPRVCPGKFLGLLEVGLVLGALIKMFRFEALEPGYEARAGVSTKPANHATVRLRRR